jgi:hypothetical protein
MSDVEIAIKVGEVMRAHPKLSAFLYGFLCGALTAMVIYLMFYLLAKKRNNAEDTYTPRLQALRAFVSEKKRYCKKGKNVLYYYEIIDDNGTVTNIFTNCRTMAVEIYCQKTGCPKEYVKEHCIVRPKKMKGEKNG